jgi:hypothetical protein
MTNIIQFACAARKDNYPRFSPEDWWNENGPEEGSQLRADRPNALCEAPHPDSVRAYVQRREDEINRLLDAYLAKTDDELAAMTF